MGKCMKRMTVFLLALALSFTLGACGVKFPEPGGDPAVTTASPTAGTDPTDVPTVPPETQPESPTLPEVGQDPGGFGPIF